MTISEVLAEVDETKPNAIDDTLKIRWLSELDGQIFNEVIAKHEGGSVDEFAGYDYSDMDTELLVQFPYTNIYRNYIFAMIDYSNGESARYQDTMAMFNSNYHDFVANYNKTHMPKSENLKIF